MGKPKAFFGENQEEKGIDWIQLLRGREILDSLGFFIFIFYPSTMREKKELSIYKLTADTSS